MFLRTLWTSINQIKAAYVFNWEHEIALHAIQGESGLVSHREGSLMVLLDLWWEPGVYSRFTEGMDIRNSCLFSDVRTPV